MIDIHTHVIPKVDDGSKTLKTSIDMVKNAVNEGVTDLFCTPHYRNNYNLDDEYYLKEFESFKKAIEKENIPVNLYFGREMFVSKNYKEDVNRPLMRMNGGKYVLIEFPFEHSVESAEIVYEITTLGFIPIVAHVERYGYVKIDEVREIKSYGGLIQINAGSVVGEHKKHFYKDCKKLLKEGLVDFVASDIHEFRSGHMQEAFTFISKKFGSDYAEKLFNENAKKIIEG